MAKNFIGLKNCCPSIENLNKLVIIMKIWSDDPRSMCGQFKSQVDGGILGC